MKALTCLENPADYRPGLWDLRKDNQQAKYWADVFRFNTGLISELIHGLGHDKTAVLYREVMFREIEKISAGFYSTVHEVTVKRQDVLKDLKIADPFREIKKKENDEALRNMRELGERDKRIREYFYFAVESLLRGNLFDMGNYETALMWRKGELDYGGCLDLKEAGSLFENVSSIVEKSAVILVDNAGRDFVNGAVCFIKALLRMGFETTTIGANSEPALNDITYDECMEISDEISRFDHEWKEDVSSGKVVFVKTGCRTPGIDLLSVEDEFDSAVTRAGLLVLTGQGRAIETTYSACISKPTVRLARVKDRMVASFLGKRQFESIIEFR
ncbi:DUF89 family protein [candidate division WOR-3 bacterium]|nr:DUF89 family protein [candidate division WOR-3 bacterium]